MAAYSIAAALVTTALFAADGAYRWYHDTRTEVAAPARPVTVAPKTERSVKAADPAPVSPQPTIIASQGLTQAPERQVVAVEAPADTQPVGSSVPIPADGFMTSTAGGPVPNAVSGSIANPTRGTVPSLAGGAIANEVARPQSRPKVSRQPKRQARQAPPAKPRAKPVVDSRAKARRPVQTAKPNVYFERDRQLGFAAQLRTRTCNPATGNMPMQCYYPREGREKFPAKPLN